MNYEEWLSSVPATITDDALWQTAVYRQALFLGDLCWYDISKLVKDRRTVSLSDQLYRAAGGISANIASEESASYQVELLAQLLQIAPMPEE
jgi:hypothetical protein